MLFLGNSHGIFPLFLAALCDQFLLRLDQSGDMPLCESQRSYKVCLWNLICSTFNHHYIGLISYVDQVQIALSPFLKGRINNQFTINPPHTNRSDWSRKWDIRDRESSRGSIHGHNISIIDAIRCEKKSNDLRIIKIAFGEKRPQRTIRHPAGQNFFFRRTPLSLKISTRENTGRCSSFLVFN